MMKKECIAMLLAGGQGSRLGALTKHIAKPGVSFGGKYRIIDFALSNCMNSGIDTVGIMTQYRPLLLNSYIGTGAAWDMDIPNGGITVLPPYATSSSFKWYQGTADAVYQNIDYINQYNPEYVLILSGDHLYRMDYSAMLEEHKKNNADLTISVIEVPWKEASRFGIMTANEEGRVVKFTEKPANPDSNLASMGIYIFNWNVLKEALTEDHSAKQTAHDFGKNVIPKLLDEGKNLFTYEFNGYWKDIGTIDSYYDACMELLDPSSDLGLFNPYEGRIMSNLTNHAPAYIGPSAKVMDSIVCTGCEVFGEIEHSIISIDVVIGEGSKIKNSILLPGVRIGKNACVENAIVAENVKIGENVKFGSKKEISVAGDDLEEAK